VKSKKRTMSPRTLCVLIVVGALVAVAAGAYVLVLPQRHKAARLDRETAQTQQAITEARLAAQPQHVQPIHVANLFKLVKAMPDTPDMPGLLLQLNQTARDAGIEFDSITVGALTAGMPVPIQLEFNGNFYDLDDFLFRLRNLVTVRGGALQATGRLFSVQSIDFGEGAGGFPSVSAKLALNAYMYSPPATPGAAPASIDATAPTTDTTETTPTDSGVVAEGNGAAS
jgi:hypothetical protein